MDCMGCKDEVNHPHAFDCDTDSQMYLIREITQNGCVRLFTGEGVHPSQISKFTRSEGLRALAVARSYGGNSTFDLIPINLD